MMMGYVAWWIARRFVRRFHAHQGGDSPPGGGLSSGLVPMLGMGVWGGYVFWRTDDPKLILAALIPTILFLSIGIVDLEAFRIPNELVWGVAAWGGAQVVWLGRPSWQAGLLGVLIAGGIFSLLAWAGRGALGMGDVKFAAAEGALLGFPLILPGLLLGIVFGGVVAGMLLLTRRAGRKDVFAYGPYLALGGWLIYLMSLHLLPWQP